MIILKIFRDTSVCCVGKFPDVSNVTAGVLNICRLTLNGWLVAQVAAQICCKLISLSLIHVA